MKRILITTAVLTLLLNISFISVNAFPPAPHRFRGYVFNENGELVSDDTIVTANLNGVYYNTTVKDGKYGYPLLTEYFYINGSGSEVGDIIYFYIDGQLTDQTANFQQMMVNVDNSPYFNLSLDTTPPIIGSVSASSITTSAAKITWDTNENSNSTVNYGKTISLGNTKKENSFVKNHDVTITNLESDTKYYFEVISYDVSGNYAIDDNSGSYFSFTTIEDSSGGNGGTPPSNGGNGGGVLPPIDDGQTENKAPVVDLNGPYYGIVNKSITFDASKSNDQDGYIVEYSWDFGDGTTQKTTDTTITHKYLTADNYTVGLTVTDNEGATNSTTTYAYISAFDTDGDGWSDEAEEYYGTDPFDPDDYPLDSDGDGIPDEWDPDDDNDGLTDEEEMFLGSNPKDPSDVLRIISDHGLFFLVDTNGDGELDHYYCKSSGIKTQLKKIDDNTFLIDVDNDSYYEYIYNFETGLEIYQDEAHSKDTDVNLTTLIIAIIVLAIIIIIVIVIYLKKPKKEKIKIVKKSSDKKVEDKKNQDIESRIDDLFKKKK